MILNKNNLLLASVFVTGAAVLIIEIVALRILSPYFGNTIFTASSVIGTVLAALSFGYYIGGRLSDKYPEHRFFYGIIFLSGILVILMKALTDPLLSIFSSAFSIAAGPLISSVFMFFAPAFSMGMLSPFAIKLCHLTALNENEIGSQSGKVFFWSTIGSIAGSLLSGFLFIPHFGITSIIIGTGIFLSLWGILGILMSGSINKIFLLFLASLIFYEIIFAWLTLVQSQPDVIYEKDGLYEKIRIADGKWLGRDTRFLFQDRSYSAAMYLDSDELVFDYSKYYELYKIFNPHSDKFFLIGGGAYSIQRAILEDSPNIKIDVAEIEPELFDLAQKYFRLQKTTRLANYTEDGRLFLRNNQKVYDVIITDVYYSFFSMPIHFTTKEFFSLAKSRLSDNGVFIGNFVGDLNQESPSFILSEIRTFKNVFQNSYFFTVDSPISSAPQNIIFLGINGKKLINFESDEVSKNKDPIIQNLKKKNIDLGNYDFSKYREITDDFSPVEYYVSRLFTH